jgi:hypothetical protein
MKIESHATETINIFPAGTQCEVESLEMDSAVRGVMVRMHNGRRVIAINMLYEDARTQILQDMVDEARVSDSTVIIV